MRRHILTGHTRFVLLDANLVAGYYLPESLSHKKAREIIADLVNSVDKGGSPEVVLYVPNFVIAEVFAVFSRYRFSRSWDRQVKKNMPKGLRQTPYQRIRARFHNDLHNCRLFNQVALDRYHVLATDLISPVDAHFQYYRHRHGGRKNQKRPMGAADHLVIGMGIWLARTHGHDNFAIMTADTRLARILDRAKSVKPTTAEKLGLPEAAGQLGLTYGPDIYPQVIYLGKRDKRQLADFFGQWPLPVKPHPKRESAEIGPADRKLLAQLRKQSGIPRDQLPYTQAFEDICVEFERRTGRAVDRNQAWRAILTIEKSPKRG